MIEDVLFARNHIGALKESVELKFTNGYTLTLTAGVIMSMSVTMATDPSDRTVAITEERLISDPRTPTERETDQHAAETYATREGDYPR